MSSMNRCQVCCKPVRARILTGVQCGTKVWHKSCFLCEVCNLQLTAKSYWSHTDRIYCIKHRESGIQNDYATPSTPQNLPVPVSPWYHGKLEPEDTETLLLKDGDFLVRLSHRENKYVLSLRWNTVHHYTIPGAQGGWLYHGEVLPTVDKWIERQHERPVNAQLGAILKRPIIPCRKPVSKQVSVGITHSPDAATNRNVSEESEDDDYLVPINRTCSIAEETGIETWYHGEKSREDVEPLLVQDGNFLYRKSRNNQEYVLSIMWNSSKLHFEIPRAQGGYKYYEQVLPTIEEWIKVQYDSGRPVNAKIGAILKRPIENRPAALISKRNSAKQCRRTVSQFDEICFNVKTGNICSEEVDCIMTSTTIDLDLSKGALSRAVLQAAGPQIQTELVKKKASNVQDFDIILTNGCKLPCKYVIHVVCPPWAGPAQSSDQAFRTMIQNALKEASRLGCQSLAIPPIGTGALGYPRGFTCRAVCEEIATFINVSSTEPSLRDIRIVVLPDNESLYNAFDAMLNSNTDRSLTDEVYRPTEYENYYTKLQKTYDEVTEEIVTAKTIALPKSWMLSLDSKKPYEKFELDRMSSEFQVVINNVKSSDGERFINMIMKIERIETSQLYQIYETFKKTVIQKNGKDVENEQTLWHGTHIAALENIYASGFNRAYCDRNATKYGRGVCFARNFSYSACDAYSPPDCSGLKYVFQCRVLTGLYTTGEESLLVPPVIESTQLRYDSVVDDLENPEVFVIFNDNMMYPEYLITFYDQ